MGALELQLDRIHFLNTLYKAQGVIDKKSTVNVLSHLLLTTGDDGIRVTGTDYDVILQADLPAKVLQAGQACVNGKSLFDVIKSLDDPAIHLRVMDNHWIEIEAGKSRFKLAGMSAGDFPSITMPEEVSWLGIDRGTLKDIIEKTAFSVSHEESRMNLNGVFFQIEPAEDDLARLTMVSTDGHRLSRVEVDVEARGYDGQKYEAIVHKKGVSEIRKLLEDDIDVVDVGFAKGRVLFRCGGTTFIVRQIEDTYPDYQRVIPPSSSVKLTVNRQKMMQALRRISSLTSSKTYIIKVQLKEGRFIFTASNPDYGEGQDELEVDYQGDEIAIGFNYMYILDVLGVIHGEEAVFELNDAYSPAVISSPAEPGALFVVMPMRI